MGNPRLQVPGWEGAGTQQLDEGGEGQVREGAHVHKEPVVYVLQPGGIIHG